MYTVMSNALDEVGEKDTGVIRGAEGGNQATPVGDHHQLVVERTCQHGRGGHCNIHGRGAVRKFRGGYKMSIGRGGVPVKRYQRHYYYECQTGKLAQTRLAFDRVANIGTDDAVNTSTSTEGQNEADTNKD